MEVVFFVPGILEIVETLSEKLGISEPIDTESSVLNWLVDNPSDNIRKEGYRSGDKIIEHPGWSQKFSPFRELPLRKRYGLTAPWGKDSETPGGHPVGPPYEAYEHMVRKAMVRIRRGASTKSLIAKIPPDSQ